MSLDKFDINPIMYSILKMIEYKVQIIIFSQKFHDYYTYLLGKLCKTPKSFNGQRYRCGIYCALKPPPCAPLFQTKVQGSIFTFSDSLPTVKSNAIMVK